MWIATKPFRYRNVSYQAGDIVPAKGWANRRALVATRRIREVSEASPRLTPDQPPDISKMKRDELNNYALSLGIETPDDKTLYPNRETIIAKIETTLSPPTPPAESGGLADDSTLDEPPAESGGSGDNSTLDAEGDEDDPFFDLDQDSENDKVDEEG